MAAPSMRSTYLRFIAPSMLAFLLQGVYSIVDGLFVGQTTGDAGLAGINVSYPLLTFSLATGTGIGMGGAVISSIYSGAGQQRRSDMVLGHTMGLLLLVSVPLMLILLLFGEPILYAIGGREEVLVQAKCYLSVFAWGTALQVLSAGCIPLMRNKGRVLYAMVALLMGGLVNCGLDALFVFILRWGVFGAGLATVASQVVVFSFGMVFFLRKENRPKLSSMKPDWWLVVRTVKAGFAPFALALLPEVTTVVLNITAQNTGGSSAIAAFAVISYCAVAVQWLIQGITDGSQPLISKAFGAGDEHAVAVLRRANYVLAVTLGVVGMIALWALRAPLAQMFGVSSEATAVFMHAMILFTWSLGFYGITHTTTSFFYATESNRFAVTLIVGEAVGMVFFAIVLPQVMGLDGVWLTVVATQVGLTALSVVLRCVARRRLRQRMCEQRKLKESMGS